MLESINLQNILFLDIETVPEHPHFHLVPDAVRPLWEKKSGDLLRQKRYVDATNGEENHVSIYRQAGIYAEFGKIVCISCGYITAERKLRIKSFFGDDEKFLLSEFSAMLNKFCNQPGKLLCAHNGKEFDFPFLARRIIINGLPIPPVLNTAGKKPWEVEHLDTMELWRFGDYKSFTSLLLLATVLGIPTPKDDIDGSKVWEVYWNEKDIQRIVTYCQKDVLTVAQILIRYRNEPLLRPEDVEITDQFKV